MRRNRSLPSASNLLPRRIRLVKLLRAHGLRDAERLREDELVSALSRLKIVLPSAAPAIFSADLPTSSTSLSAAAAASAADASTEKTGGDDDKSADDAGDGVDAGDADVYDDPDALPRFREPKIFLPEGERTFLRLIAVDPSTLFATWDLNAAARELIDGDTYLDLIRLDLTARDAAPEEAEQSIRRIAIDLAPGGWYLEAPEAGATVFVRLGCESPNGDRVVVESNAAIVLPNREQQGGEVIFATIPAPTNREELVGGQLLNPAADLPVDVKVDRTGQEAQPPKGFGRKYDDTEGTEGKSESGAGSTGSSASDASSHSSDLPSSHSSGKLPTSSTRAGGGQP